MTRYTRSAVLTDIHFGKKNNSPQHNNDCKNYIEWFCKNTIEQKCDHVIFMGDWHENRSALNISTLNYSHQCAKQLNELGIPVFFVIGNHDLYQRHSRDIHSVVSFSEFNNFALINSPTVVDNIGDGALIVPFLFHDEYETLKQYKQIPFWAGHFEFKGFEVTGYGIKMQSGPNPDDFNGPKAILSGHFHKRQQDKNIHYIGNTFPMDMGDAGDFNRGMAVYDHRKHKLSYINWEDCPKYQKLHLSQMLDGTTKIYNNARIKCFVDVPISFEESMKIRQKFIEEYNLRELKFEEIDDTSVVLQSEISDKVVSNEKLRSIDELVLEMLSSIESSSMESEILIDIYKTLDANDSIS